MSVQEYTEQLVENTRITMALTDGFLKAVSDENQEAADLRIKEIAVQLMIMEVDIELLAGRGNHEYVSVFEHYKEHYLNLTTIYNNTFNQKGN